MAPHSLHSLCGGVRDGAPPPAHGAASRLPKEGNGMRRNERVEWSDEGSHGVAPCLVSPLPNTPPCHA